MSSSPPSSPPPGPALPAIKKTVLTGTLAAPRINDSIRCCSKVIHRHISNRDVANPSGRQNAFDIDNFMKRTYNVMLPVIPKISPICMFRQKLRRNQVPERPDEKQIYEFIKRICDRAHLNPENVIIALIYIERLMETKALNLSSRNWIPVVSISLLTASKVWDDHSSWNAEFAAILPLFTLKEINELERHFLTELNYMLYISPSEYARFYFALRSLKQKNPRSIPKFYLQLPLGGAQRVAVKTSHHATHQPTTAALAASTTPGGTAVGTPEVSAEITPETVTAEAEEGTTTIKPRQKALERPAKADDFVPASL